MTSSQCDFQTGVFTTAYPYWHQHSLPASTSPEELCRQSLWQLDLVLAQQTAPRDTAAIIVEPVLGEGGYIPAPPSFLRGLRDVCDKHGMLLIVDEVQSGFGRTGKYFAIEYSQVRPDILVMAKGIANGFPLSGIAASKVLMDKQAPGTMGGTYAGNAVACAAGVACAEVMKEENILANVQARYDLKILRHRPAELTPLQIYRIIRCLEQVAYRLCHRAVHCRCTRTGTHGCCGIYLAGELAQRPRRGCITHIGAG